MNWKNKDRIELVRFLQKETDKLMNLRYIKGTKEQIDIQEKRVKILNQYITDTYNQKPY
tara:strand:- start:7527 stop:7703 length:177 start_codon:yes stop_codon:yes gene_type:complete